jgi:cobalamin synthase
MSIDVLRQPSRPTWKRSVLILALSLGSAGILMAPAQAFDLLQPFKSIVNQYVQIFEGYYNRTVNDVLGGVLGDILGAIPENWAFPTRRETGRSWTR